jgi:hypothetical protein
MQHTPTNAAVCSMWQWYHGSLPQAMSNEPSWPLQSPSSLHDSEYVQIFGATEGDIADLRILSLHEIDIDKLDELARADD